MELLLSLSRLIVYGVIKWRLLPQRVVDDSVIATSLLVSVCECVCVYGKCVWILTLQLGADCLFCVCVSVFYYLLLSFGNFIYTLFSVILSCLQSSLSLSLSLHAPLSSSFPLLLTFLELHNIPNIYYKELIAS